MKKVLKKKGLIYESNTLANLLFEQEEEGGLFDEEGGDEEEAAEEEGADEEAEEGGEEEGDEEAADEGDEEAAEDDKKLDVDLDDEVKLSKSIDQDLEALFIDFEADARKSRDIDDASEEQVAESLELKMLLEQEDYEAEIDLERFSSEVARLVKNYTTLLDMEKMLVSKAREFVATRYGEKAESDLVDMLSVQHNIDIEDPINADAVPNSATPIAVGAGSGAAGGAS